MNRSEACSCPDPHFGVQSLPQLKEYDFIAHVLITSEKGLAVGKTGDQGGLLAFTIIEQFKGEEIDSIVEANYHNSCRLGVETGEEWLLYGRLRLGRLEVSACDLNRRYKDRDGLTMWENADVFRDLSTLRKLYHHRDSAFTAGTRTEYYPSGRKEIEEHYESGKLNGQRMIWYPDGTLLADENYSAGVLDGTRVWCYSSGQTHLVEFLKKGQHYNVSRQFYDTVDLFEKRALRAAMSPDSRRADTEQPKKIQMSTETYYDPSGRTILTRSFFFKTGFISQEKITQPNSGFTTTIDFHDNGVMSSIEQSDDIRHTVSYQEYDRNGTPTTARYHDGNTRHSETVK